MAGRIDVHFHMIPQFYADMVYAAGSGPAIGRYPDWSPELALELMDKSGIDVALMSLAQPGVQFTDPGKTCQPTAYYARPTLIGRVFDTELARKPALNIGAVGLGTGTVATYVRRTDRMRPLLAATPSA